LESILARNKADREAGIVRTYDHPPKPVNRPAPVSLPICEYLLDGRGDISCQHRRCEKGVGGTGGVKPCESCGPDRCRYFLPLGAEEKPPTFTTKTTDQTAGVVIGSFRWPELVELQIKVIRHNCGPVPILVSNDDPNGADRLASICKRFDDVTLDNNRERIGHTGGDIACFHKGITWGAARGIRWVTKLSQRFIVDRPRWLQDSAEQLRLSGLPMACRRTVGAEMYDLRTECVLLDVGFWNVPHVLDRIKPRRYWSDVPGGLSAERIMFRVLQDLLGEVYFPWVSLLGECRYKRDRADVLWHNNTHESEYRRLASQFGVTLPKEFHCDGWHHERAKGTYLHG
jgi:hypothetical protein